MEYLISIFLVLMSGLFSGLTIGLSSIPKSDMERLAANDDERAKKILPIIQDYNLLLVTLLLGNTVVNVILTNYLGSIIGTGIMTVALSTAAILIFGEITPAAIITKHSIRFGAYTAPLVKTLIKIFYPISKPISFILTKLLGGEEIGTFYSIADFKYIIEQHKQSDESEIDEQDSRILTGTFDLQATKAKEIIIPSNEVYSLNYKSNINQDLIKEIKIAGYTRIPIIKDNIVISVLNMKSLVALDLKQEYNVLEIADSRHYLNFNEETYIDDILEKMIDSSIHFSVISDNENNWIGIITLDNILQILFQKEIKDEDDKL